MTLKIDSRNFEKKKLRLLEDIGYIVENEAIQRCPVVTGNMRSRITHKVEGNNSVMIGTIGVPYATFVEYGTAIMEKAHGKHDAENPVTDWEALRKRQGYGQTMPFISTAVFVSKPKIDEAIKKVFK